LRICPVAVFISDHLLIPRLKITEVGWPSRILFGSKVAKKAMLQTLSDDVYRNEDVDDSAVDPRNSLRTQPEQQLTGLGV
jgi:hypothetical protein